MELLSMSNLKAKIASGVFWTSISETFDRLISLVNIAFLARLLEPKDFGLVAIVTIAIEIVNRFSDIGFEAALIQREKNIHEAASTAFFIVLFLCGVNYVLLFLISKPIAIFYNDQAIEGIMKTLSITIIIGSFIRVHNFLLSKELQFPRKAVCEIIPNIVFSLVSIPLAFSGFMVWSIVYGEIAKNVSRSLLLLFISPWQPAFKFNFKIAKELVGYGKHVMLTNLLNFGAGNVDNVIIGKYLGLTNLSFYKLSINAVGLPTHLLYQIIGRVTVPAFSKVQTDKDTIRRLYHNLLEYSSYLFVPAFFGLFLIGPNFINILYGSKWQPVIPLFKALLLFGFAKVIRTFSDSIFLATGKPSILLKVTSIRTIALLLLLFSLLKFGLLTLCLGISVLELIIMFLQLYLLNKHYNISIASNIKSLRASILLSVIMIVVLLIINKYLSSFNIYHITYLFLQISIGIVVYFLSLLMIKKRKVFRFFNLKDFRSS
jgi:O-antigen/teichoic acid export membrane protein